MDLNAVFNIEYVIVAIVNEGARPLLSKHIPSRKKPRVEFKEWNFWAISLVFNCCKGSVPARGYGYLLSRWIRSPLDFRERLDKIHLQNFYESNLVPKRRYYLVTLLAIFNLTMGMQISIFERVGPLFYTLFEFGSRCYPISAEFISEFSIQNMVASEREESDNSLSSLVPDTIDKAEEPSEIKTKQTVSDLVSSTMRAIREASSVHEATIIPEKESKLQRLHGALFEKVSRQLDLLGISISTCEKKPATASNAFDLKP